VFWGESVGLVPGPDGRKLEYCRALDRPDLHGRLADAMNHLQILLSKADHIRAKYSSRSAPPDLSRQSDRLMAFREPLHRLRDRLRRNQKETSIGKVTLWAVKDNDELRRIVEDVVKFIEDIEGVTSVIRNLDQKYMSRRFESEIENISDEETLERIMDVASQDSSSSIILQTISDSASRQFNMSSGSRRAGYTGRPGSSILTSNDSFYTAPSRASATFAYESRAEATPLVRAFKKVSQTQSEQASLMQLGRMATLSDANIYALTIVSGLDPIDDDPKSIPQHRRIMAQAQASGPNLRVCEQSFASGDSVHGHALRYTKQEDDSHSQKVTPKLLVTAESGSSSLKRMFFELRQIRQGHIPFISAAPVGDRLDRILTSIEGPPDTPYEGGIFWITVCLVDSRAYPMLRFQTRVYHPNIDCWGYICADFQNQWQAPVSHNQYAPPSSSRWYQKVSGPQWTLSSLLVALCGLLASPNLSDPLVPEIALRYTEDYEDYCRSARLYTARYATGQRPAEQDLVFADTERFNVVDAHAIREATEEATESITSPSLAGQRSIIPEDAMIGASEWSTAKLPPMFLRGKQVKFPIQFASNSENIGLVLRAIQHDHRIDLRFLETNLEVTPVLMEPEGLQPQDLQDWLDQLATDILSPAWAKRGPLRRRNRDVWSRNWSTFSNQLQAFIDGVSLIVEAQGIDVMEAQTARLVWLFILIALQLIGEVFSIASSKANVAVFLDHIMGVDDSMTGAGRAMVRCIREWNSTFLALGNLPPVQVNDDVDNDNSSTSSLESISDFDFVIRARRKRGIIP